MTALGVSEGCPPWCTNHILMDDASYHLAHDQVVHDHVLVRVGPLAASGGYDNVEPAGVYFFKWSHGCPPCSLKVPEAEAKLEELEADIAKRREIAAALSRAIEDVRDAQVCPMPERAEA